MKIYTSLEEIPEIPNPVLTAGTFDGIHQGHKKILDRLNEIAKKVNGESVLLTFYPHPRMVLQASDNNLKLLTTQREKENILSISGIQHLIKIPFTKEFSRLSAIEYVRDILVNKIGINTIIIGYDHRFGRNREGSFKDLVAYSEIYGFNIEEISAKEVDHIAISSTKIRTALADGNLNIANKLLGRNYHIWGNVVKGNHIGKTIGFPTANMSLCDTDKLIPGNGVYAVKVVFNGSAYNAMLCIGNRPTLNGKTVSIEVNIFDFDEIIYEKNLDIYFYERIRDEKKFNTLEELAAQLELDKIQALNILPEN